MLFINFPNNLKISNNLQIAKISICKSKKKANSNVKFTMTAENDEDLMTPEEKERFEKIKRLKEAEKFMEIDEGKYECQACGYLYEPEKGDIFAGIKAMTKFEDLPSEFSCPACRSPKSQFKSVKKVIAGFAENQKYGLGGNSLTGGQKNTLIFGLLGVAFLLLLSGYLLE
mmetsp:Transcript_45864/g.71863  ORF Transcript_45864/g.71863 Transcript_45864/m.71863 type:complete len:171 (-) Transcript_45864:1531-2043(-)